MSARHNTEVARLYAAGWQPETIAARFGVKPQTVHTYAHQARRAGIDVPRAPATGGFARRHDYAALLRMAQAGTPNGEIARALGCSRNLVSKVLTAMRRDGVPLPPGGRWPERGA